MRYEARMAFALGLVAWSLLEYLLHRFAFHAAGRLLGRRHRLHHADVDARALAVATPAAMLAGAGLGGLVLVAVLGAPAGLTAFAGLMLGYALYELTHFSVHYVKLDQPWFRALKRYHLSHHCQAPHARFGVTSPAWDIVFGTFRLPARARASSRVD